ncbi:MAG: orotidine-5'-phosphate decarboxylase [Acidimicrobiales bacterium]|jgi:orotidine-5'-phosphate decarboxylase
MAGDGGTLRPGYIFSAPVIGRQGGSGKPEVVRQRLVLALDVDDSVLAMRWASRLRPWFGVAKVGLELFSAAGPTAIGALLEGGFKVFVDLKMADIPNTTRRAARVLGALGVSFLTVHASAGPATLEAAVQGLAEGAERAGLAPPVALGVTVLTSEAEAPADLLRARVASARDAGCGGVVCAAADLDEVKAVAPGLLTVVPGIRPAGTDRHDQGRAATPGHAIRHGADMLVIGRAVTGAEDPEKAALSIVEEVSDALSGR